MMCQQSTSAKVLHFPLYGIAVSQPLCVVPLYSIVEDAHAPILNGLDGKFILTIVVHDFLLVGRGSRQAPTFTNDHVYHKVYTYFIACKGDN